MEDETRGGGRGPGGDGEADLELELKLELVLFTLGRERRALFSFECGGVLGVHGRRGRGLVSDGCSGGTREGRR